MTSRISDHRLLLLSERLGEVNENRISLSLLRRLRRVGLSED